ncbi:MAG: DUF3800 domain-containing protein [Sulfobacillus sp.]
MYLLFLDESGTHSPSSPFILAGIAIHERDAPHLARRVEGNLTYRLAPAGLNPKDFELHATALKSGKDEWKGIPVDMRFLILGSTYRAITTYECIDKRYPMALFGAVVDGRYSDRERMAYELVLNKFDEMLDRHRFRGSERQSGLVIHDRRVVAAPTGPTIGSRIQHERRIQEWTRNWQEVAGKVGQLHNFADVPLFADSRSTRLVQVADFVCWSLSRFYALPSRDERWVRSLWGLFQVADGHMHNLIHVTPDYEKKRCICPPCKLRQTVVIP